ncbi:MAG: pitrilysin family protein [candidate division WOR-3 bacterium]
MKKTFYLIIIILLSFLIFSETLYKRDFKIFKLDNGLEVLMVKTTTQPIVTIEIAVKNGSYTQTPENCGLSHLYEHMFFKGNVKWKSQEEYNKRIRELGIIYNGMTSNESVRYYFTLPSKNIDEGLEFMSYAIMDPLFDSVELEKERNVVLNEFDRDFSVPFYKFYQMADSVMYEKYFYRKNTIGFKNVIANATREQMYEIKNRYYIPNNCALVIVGNIDFDKTEKSVKKYFDRWEKGKDVQFDFPQHPILEKNKKFIIVDKVATTKYLISFRAPNFDGNSNEPYAFDLLSDYLSLTSSKLYKDLVESGLVYNYYVGYSGLKDGSEFSFYLDLRGENIDTVKKILFEHIKNLNKIDYYDNDLLQHSKEYGEVNTFRRLESSLSFALTLGYWWCVGGVDNFKNYNERIKNISKEDIISVVSKYISNGFYMEGFLTDSTTYKKKLSFLKGE